MSAALSLTCFRLLVHIHACPILITTTITLGLSHYNSQALLLSALLNPLWGLPFDGAAVMHNHVTLGLLVELFAGAGSPAQGGRNGELFRLT